VDQKSRKVILGLPAQDSLPGLCEAFFGAAETLQKRLCNASDTPQKHSKRHPHLHLYVFSHRGEFHDQCAKWSTPNARASAPSSFLRPLTPDSAPDVGTCCLNTFLGPAVFHEDSESEVRLQKSRPAAKLRHVYYEKNQLKPRKTYINTHLALVHSSQQME
jgi:hypothetical protein